ncbi:MAG: xanthine dehydrogenase family protein subunit M [Anaerolineales bacterium]
MKPASFEYHAPTSLEEALSLIADSHGDSKLLAGGQSLVPAMNFRIMQPAVLVDLNPIESMDYIKTDDEGGLRIGAMTRQAQVESDPNVAESAPLLHEAMPLIAHRQIRNRGTIGGSLVHADPAAELPVVAVTLGAEMVIHGQSGERSVSADSFFQGMFTTDVQPDEILTEIRFPPQPAGSGWSFQELARRAGDYAMAGVAVLVSLDDEGVCQRARVVYLNVGDGPTDATQAASILIGERGTPDLFEAAAEKAAADEIFPYGNVHASVDYQQHLARVLTVRALSQAWERAAPSGLD